MNLKAIVPFGLLVFALLAGCSDAPSAGTLVAKDMGLAATISGTADLAYVAESHPVDGAPTACVPQAVPVDQGHCTQPSSSIHIHFMQGSLPEPDGNGWALYMANGTTDEHQLAALAEKDGMYDYTYNATEDWSSKYDSVQARMGDFTYATASSKAGKQTFALAPGLPGITVTGTFKGKVLTIDVSGLPGSDTTKFTGWLYEMGPSGNLTRTVSFPVVAGAQSFTAEKDISDFKEFHIHVGASMVNLYKSTITEKKAK